MVALVDFSKAFNRINHAKVIVRLSDWGVPGWLLKILISYLTGRSMILRYKDVQSARHLMPGGSPQGALLGVLLYLIYVSDIGMDLPHIPQDKYVDDLSLVECIKVETQLKQTGNVMFLPPGKSSLQKRLDECKRMHYKLFLVQLLQTMRTAF